MGEHSIFVWPCYVATIILLVGLCFYSWKNKRNDENELLELQDQMDNTDK